MTYQLPTYLQMCVSLAHNFIFLGGSHKLNVPSLYVELCLSEVKYLKQKRAGGSLSSWLTKWKSRRKDNIEHFSLFRRKF